MTIRVLLADDHGIVRDGLRVLLENESDMTVVGEAENGRQAIRQVSELCPDVVVMDIAMPELNGIDATHSVLEICPDTRVVILSMLSTTEHIFRAFQSGARGYVLKESAGVELVAAIRSVHAGTHYLSRKISDISTEDFLFPQPASRTKSPLERLSTREREILQLVAEGNTSAEIADLLSLSPKTVETYRSRIMHKLDVHGLPELIKFALQNGIAAGP